MYLQCNWTQLFLLLCSFPLPALWRGTDNLRTHWVSCSHCGTKHSDIHGDSDLRKAEVFSINHHPDTQVPLCLARTLLHNPRVVCTRNGFAQGWRESSFCPCPLPLLQFSTIYTSWVQEPACCLYSQSLHEGVSSTWWPFLPHVSPGSNSYFFP